MQRYCGLMSDLRLGLRMFACEFSAHDLRGLAVPPMKDALLVPHSRVVPREPAVPVR
jgi:hypothetical protein